MKQISNAPLEGQFVAVWVYNNQVWSDVYRWDGVDLWVYTDTTDDFDKLTYLDTTAWGNNPKITDVKFFEVD